MNVPSSSRGRGVRLSEAAAKLFSARLEEQFFNLFGPRRATKRALAELVNVSEKTLDRIVRREKVDRGTLLSVSAALGITWEEGFLAEEADDFYLIPARKQFIRAPWAISIAVALVALTLTSVLLLRPGTHAAQPPATGRAAFFRRLSLGTEYYQSARFEKARAEFLACHEMASEANDWQGVAESLRMLADVDMARGDYRQARDRYARALELRVDSGQIVTLPAIQNALGLAELRLGNYSQARKWLREALTGYVSLNERVGESLVQRDLGEVCKEMGDLDGALAWLASARSGSDRTSDPATLTSIRAQEADVLRELGRVEESERILEDCLDYWTSKRHPRWIATTQLQLSRTKLQAGKADESARLAKLAADAFQRVGDKGGFRQATSMQKIP